MDGDGIASTPVGSVSICCLGHVHLLVPNVDLPRVRNVDRAGAAQVGQRLDRPQHARVRPVGHSGRLLHRLGTRNALRLQISAPGKVIALNFGFRTGLLMQCL